MGRVKTPSYGIRDAYFSLWSLTEKGASDPAAVRRTIETASAMIRDAKGECNLYVTIGGPWDLIGVATGVSDETIVAIQKAIQAFGTLRTDFVKTKEHSLPDFAKQIGEVKRFQALKP